MKNEGKKNEKEKKGKRKKKFDQEILQAQAKECIPLP